MLAMAFPYKTCSCCDMTGIVMYDVVDGWRLPVQVVELRKRTDNLPDDYWVVLVGDMITEEALPTYMAMLNTLDGVRDETGAAPTPWGRHASGRHLLSFQECQCYVHQFDLYCGRHLHLCYMLFQPVS